MCYKIYNLADKKLTKSIMAAGLSEYKMQRLVRFANENKINLQKAYLHTDASFIKLDLIMMLFILFFSCSIAVKDSDELWAFFLIFGAMFIILESTCRFHKGFFKIWRVYLKLRKL